MTDRISKQTPSVVEYVAPQACEQGRQQGLEQGLEQGAQE